MSAIKFRKVDGWTYVSSNNCFEIKNVGRCLWSVLEIGLENQIVAERQKQYFTSYAEAKNYAVLTIANQSNNKKDN